MFTLLPNLLSLFRIIITPLVLFALTRESYFGALVFFTIGTLSDFYDGYFARKYNLISKSGSFLDPLADKIFVLSIYAMLAHKNLLPWYVFGIIISRDLLITLMRTLLLRQKRELQTSQFGKAKTIMQFLSIYWVLVEQFLLLSGFDQSILCALISQSKSFVIGIMVIMTVLSGADYIWNSQAHGPVEKKRVRRPGMRAARNRKK